ncbi:MAG: peptide deformylase, partial [Verrucomicrobiae bacterium]|nr:peptide deformylase [Verrucomicrobiae bacterium]
LMVLEIVKDGHPVLRKSGEQIKEITPEIKQLIADMFETMAANNGVGLAAQQVGYALQLMVLDIREVKDRPSTMEINGKTVNPADYMPLAIINPQITPEGPNEVGPEGCLSFPEIYADISRPGKISISAVNQNGEQISFKCGGLLARAIQHEYDHLKGTLFIDRMDRETFEELLPEIEKIKRQTTERLNKKPVRR